MQWQLQQLLPCCVPAFTEMLMSSSSSTSTPPALCCCLHVKLLLRSSTIALTFSACFAGPSSEQWVPLLQHQQPQPMQPCSSCPAWFARASGPVKPSGGVFTPSRGLGDACHSIVQACAVAGAGRGDVSWQQALSPGIWIKGFWGSCERVCVCRGCVSGSSAAGAV